ncbi:DUF6376 family protein [Bacillus carboniphilus]|uniref:DUF6376 family protein n=1 Tax=Bacillus carboniphilus TaxID=86663 RepID=A0ABN0W7Y7_9BACI
MKKWFGLVALLFLLSGCSLIEGVNNTLEYVNEATDYINEASQFAGEVPALAEQAVSDPAAREQLVQQLEEMKEEIGEFNQLEPPGIAKDIHQKIEEYNTTIQTTIDQSLEKINEGQYKLEELLSNSPLIQTIENLQNTLNQLEQLGNG